jgi:hypothetical protein
MLKTFARWTSSSALSRSNSNVAMPCSFNASATAVLRGLKRLEPLPWPVFDDSVVTEWVIRVLLAFIVGGMLNLIVGFVKGEMTKHQSK